MRNDQGNSTALRFYDSVDQVKSWVSESLFRLAAADCGATTRFPAEGQDVDAVDCILSIKGMAHHIQLKSTSSESKITKTGIRVDIKPKWRQSWNILTRNSQRVFLVIYQLNEDPAEWIDFREGIAVAEHNAFWIEWNPELHGSNKSILIPFDQPFDTWTIVNWASAINFGFGE